MELTEGTVVAERFRLDRPLGQGGMGAVWLARHLSLDIPCALKFLHPEAAAAADIRARFEREARAAAQLRSPNVVQILDHGLWQGAPYIAMELLEGEDLEHRLHRAGALSPRETAAIVSQVARALTRAHAAGLVHRDLKPANIFLVRDDDREIVKVLDFGVAKQALPGVADGKTKTGTIMGTPYYMSPEQARGVKEVDHRSDLWALGVIAYQCLLGRLPFESDALGDLFMLIMAEPLPVPSRIAVAPPGFDAWWARAMARPAGERFQSAREMADSLAMALGVSIHSDAPAPIHPGAGPSQPPPWSATTPLGSLSPQTASAIVAEVSPAPPARATRSWGVGAGAAVLVIGALGIGGALLAVRGKPAVVAPASAVVEPLPVVSAGGAPAMTAAPVPEPPGGRSRDGGGADRERRPARRLRAPDRLRAFAPSPEGSLEEACPSRRRILRPTP